MSKAKSQLGVRRNITEPPPRVHGKPWWTTPPIAPPLPAHLAYAKEYKARLAASLTDGGGQHQRRVQEKLTMVNAWIKQANIIYAATEHERTGFARADDLWIATGALLGKLIRAAEWEELTLSEQRAADAVKSRAYRARLRRAGRLIEAGDKRLPSA